MDHSQGGPHGDMDDPLAWLRESVPGDVMPALKLPMSVVRKSVPIPLNSILLNVLIVNTDYCGA